MVVDYGGRLLLTEDAPKAPLNKTPFSREPKASASPNATAGGTANATGGTA